MKQIVQKLKVFPFIRLLSEMCAFIEKKTKATFVNTI